MDNIKLKFYSHLNSTEADSISNIRENNLSYDNDTTIQELFDSLNEPIADLSAYYYLSGEYVFDQKLFPYLLTKENDLKWNVPYEKAKVVDLINTLQVKDQSLKVEIGIVQAGGMGINEIAQIWNDYGYIIKILATTTTFLATSTTLYLNLVKIYDQIKSKFINQDVPPQSINDLIFSREEWNHYQLADLIGIEIAQSKGLLTGLGYEWDNTKKLYFRSEISDKIQENLSKIYVISNDYERIL